MPLVTLEPPSHRPLVALIGAPNSGKSTLFNRIANADVSRANFRPRALVRPEAGTTRDRLEATCEWRGHEILVQDTSGVEHLVGHSAEAADSAKRRARARSKGGTDAAAALSSAMEQQVLNAIGEAALILFIVDARTGVTLEVDRLAAFLRRLRSSGAGKDVLLVANKTETADSKREVADLWALGLDEPHQISALHGSGTGDLLDLVVERLDARGLLQAGVEEEHELDEEDKYDLDDEEGYYYDDSNVSTNEGRAMAAYDDAATAGHGDGKDEAPQGGSPLDDGTSLVPLEDEYEFEGTDDDEGWLEKGIVGAGAAARGKVGKIAIVGRPNVGKSSMLNTLIGEDRMVVHEQPGTTRDSVATPCSWRGRDLLLVDTAGIRKAKMGGDDREELDRIAVSRAKMAIGQCHVALLLLDASAGFLRMDKKIASLVLNEHKSCILVANKCDLLTEQQAQEFSVQVQKELASLTRYAPIVRTSALKGDGLADALDTALEAAAWREHRVSKRILNELFRRASTLRPLPKEKGVRLKIQYATQLDNETPTFAIQLNREAELHPSVLAWMRSTIRSQWPFVATPLRLLIRASPPRRRRHILSHSPSKKFLGFAESRRRVRMPKRKFLAIQEVRRIISGAPKPGRSRGGFRARREDVQKLLLKKKAKFDKLQAKRSARDQLATDGADSMERVQFARPFVKRGGSSRSVGRGRSV